MSMFIETILSSHSWMILQLLHLFDHANDHGISLVFKFVATVIVIIIISVNLLID